MSSRRLQFLGGGKMAEALLAGLIRAGWSTSDELAVIERLGDRREQLASSHPGVDVRVEPLEAVDVLIAVKPQDIPAAVAGLTGLGVTRVLSIAAGVTTAALENRLDPGTRVVRAMPNTPALVGAGAAALAPGALATSDDLDWAAEILRSVGSAVVVVEEDLDAVTGLSGSGPAYLFYLAEALIAAGIEQGLHHDVAVELVEQTLYGAARLLRESEHDPVRLRSDVTSPGGTTAEGIAVLEAADVRGTISRVVAAATRRSRELGA